MPLPHRAAAELEGGIFNEQRCLILPDVALKALLHASIGFI